MQVFTRVFVLTILVGASFILFVSDLAAQNMPVVPISIDQAIRKARQEGIICSIETINNLDPSEREARREICGLNLEIEPESIQSSSADTPEGPTAQEIELQASIAEPNSSTAENNQQEQISLLPDPEVQFVEDYMLNFGDNENRNTIFYGGVVPFVAIPDTELATDDSFFNEDSFSVFFYLKRKF
ncbi:MAG: hypothetical protein AAF462_11735 [Thermodesulfobacteriota bacterium]